MSLILGLDNDPISFNQNKQRANSQKWMGAMLDELKSMKDNDVWDLEEFPKGIKSIDGKWVFKTKLDSKSDVKNYKVSLVAESFTKKRDFLSNLV